MEKVVSVISVSVIRFSMESAVPAAPRKALPDMEVYGVRKMEKHSSIVTSGSGAIRTPMTAGRSRIYRGKARLRGHVVLTIGIVIGIGITRLLDRRNGLKSDRNAKEEGS